MGKSLQFNERNTRRNTVLVEVAEKGHLDLVKLFSKMESDPNLKPHGDINPLTGAMVGRKNSVDGLLKVLRSQEGFVLTQMCRTRRLAETSKKVQSYRLQRVCVETASEIAYFVSQGLRNSATKCFHATARIAEDTHTCIPSVLS